MITLFFVLVAFCLSVGATLQLEKDCGVGPHTISIPRLQPAMNAPAAV